MHWVDPAKPSTLPMEDPSEEVSPGANEPVRILIDGA
jgi:hypothetical protein